MCLKGDLVILTLSQASYPLISSQAKLCQMRLHKVGL